MVAPAVLLLILTEAPGSAWFDFSVIVPEMLNWAHVNVGNNSAATVMISNFFNVSFLVKPLQVRGTYSPVKLHNSNPYAGIIRIRCMRSPGVAVDLNGYALSLFLCFLQNKAPLFDGAKVLKNFVLR